MNTNDGSDNENPGELQQPWPPPPDGDSMAAVQTPDPAEIKALVRRARLLCMWGFVFCAIFQPFTIYFALKANRAAGRNVANGFTTAATIQMCIVASAVIGYAVFGGRR